MALIAEVFVGKLNGAGKLSQAARPAWASLWFALFSFGLFIPLGLLGTPIFAPAGELYEHGAGYFSTMMYFAPTFSMVAGLSAFFVGIGSVRVVTLMALVGNVLNIGLDYLFVFGFEPFVPAMGAQGAALASGISQGVQVLILAWVFFSKHNRLTYGTHEWHFHWPQFKQNMVVGVPAAAGHMIEFSAWAILMRMMAEISVVHITVLAIGQSFHQLFSFGIAGLQKAVAAISANYLGAGKWSLVRKTLRSSMVVLTGIMVLLSIPLLFFPGLIVREFISGDVAGVSVAELVGLSEKACGFVFVYLLLDGLVWIVAGVLTALEDTKAVMVINAFCAWTFAIFPAYVFMVKLGASPGHIWLMFDIYALVNLTIFGLRYLHHERRLNGNNDDSGRSAPKKV